MVKISSSNILDILRRFEVAGDEHMPRHIERIHYTNTTALNTLISFRFLKRNFVIVFDEEAVDSERYVTEQVQLAHGDVNGTLAKNLTDYPTDYAMRFRERDVYLFEEEAQFQRLDNELSARYPETSRSTWQKHIKAGHILVNGEVAETPKQPVGKGDDIAINVPPVANHSDKELPIVYIDDDVIVINKPIGVLSHAKGALNDEFTVADFFRRYTEVGLETNRPGIVHRLDRDTSGIMIGARTEAAATLLQKQFADRRAKKAYYAVLSGHPKNDHARIDLPIGRNPNAPSTFRVDPKGKVAVTNYTILNKNATESLVELRPKTGRTHQLRVHMAYLKTPIVGDRVYGTPSDRLYLHAHSLEVTTPGGTRHTFTAPVPDSFTERFTAGE